METIRRLLGVRLRSSKRFLLFSLFFLLLSASLVIYRFDPFAKPLRRDVVPNGAYVIPWMRPIPSLFEIASLPPNSEPWNITSIMAGSLSLSMTFRVELPNETRVIPSIIYLGHDQYYLYVGAVLRGMSYDPTSRNGTTLFFPNLFGLFFDVESDGRLTFPEAGSYLGVTIECPFLPSTCGRASDGWGAPILWQYHEHVWDDNLVLHRMTWILESDVTRCTPFKGTWSFSSGQVAVEYNSNSGDLGILFSRHLSNPGDCVNALQMGPGELWVMGFLIEAGYQNYFSSEGNFIDGWPMKAYPYLNNDASWWPKLAMDLANPPSNLPTP